MHEFSARVLVIKGFCNVTWKGTPIPSLSHAYSSYRLLTFVGRRITFFGFRIQYHLCRFGILPAEHGTREDSCSIAVTHQPVKINAYIFPETICILSAPKH